MSSGKVICFTDSRGNPLFSLPDSSFLCLASGQFFFVSGVWERGQLLCVLPLPQRGTGGNRRKMQEYPSVCKADGEEWNPVSAHE